jgi:branched-chain amino acid transport system substrate-binding protein
MMHLTWKVLGLLGMALVLAPPAHAEVAVGLAAPLTGPYAWAGGANEGGAKAAVADLNGKGGVLGEQIELVTADDYCDGEQAVAAANKLIASGVVAVFGHQCSGAAIPASKVYADAGLLLVATEATNPKLTAQGLTNVFRMVGRDDVQGQIAAELLSMRWGSRPIAILHDGQAYGKGLAEETRRRLNERGIAEALFEAIEPGKADYWNIVQKMRAKGIEVLYFGGYQHEAALIIRQAREHGYQLQLVAGDGIGSEDFALIAGPSSDGTLITAPPRPMHPEAAELRRRFPDDFSFETYAAFQVWAGAVEKAGTFETQAVAQALRTHEFDTALGRIGFDAKGDVTGHDTFVWYLWKDGQRAPVEAGKLTE